MNAATITPLPDGKALFSWRGIEKVFDDVFEAQAEAAAHQIPAWVVRVDRFPPTPIATSPGLRVL